MIRKDLPLYVQLVQACHAALEAGKHYCRDPAVDHLIVLEVPDEEALLKAHARAEDRGIRTVLFREPDFANVATGFCTEPIHGNRRKIFSEYPLWKETNYVTAGTAALST